MRTIFICAYRNMASHLKSFLAIFVCCIVSFVLLDLLVTRYFSGHSDILEVKRIIKCDTDNVYCIINNSMEPNDIELAKATERFAINLSEIEGVDCAGTYGYTSLQDKNEGIVNVLCMEPKLLKIVLGDDANYFSNTEMYGYIGKTLKENLIKDIKTLETRGFKFEIIGEIPYGTRWFASSFNSLLGDTVSLDNYILVNKDALLMQIKSVSEENYYMYLAETMYYSKFLLVLDGSADKKWTLDAIYDSAIKEGLNIKIQNIEDMFKEYTDGIKKDEKPVLIRVIVMLILSGISVSSMCTVNILLNRRNFGIMYCNGIRKIQIYLSCILENVLKITVSAIVSFSISSFIIRQNVFTYKELEMLMYIRYHITIWVLIGIYAIMVFLVNIIPIHILRSYKTVDLIKGKD